MFFSVFKFLKGDHAVYLKYLSCVLLLLLSFKFSFWGCFQKPQKPTTKYWTIVKKKKKLQSELFYVQIVCFFHIFFNEVMNPGFSARSFTRTPTYNFGQISTGFEIKKHSYFEVALSWTCTTKSFDIYIDINARI